MDDARHVQQPHRVAIMQPTYLPWMGYFALMDQVDQFVFLNDVQFSKRSWQKRNRIKLAGQEHTLTLPISSKDSRGDRIIDIRINQQIDWKHKHLETLRRAYLKADFFDTLFPWLESVYGGLSHSLSEANSSLIQALAEKIGIQTPCLDASQLSVSGVKSERLANIVTRLQGGQYLSPPGSFGYIDEDNHFERQGISLRYLHYEHPEYPQLGQEFVSHLAILDLLFNVGPEQALAVIRKGYRPPLTHEQLSEKLKDTDEH